MYTFDNWVKQCSDYRRHYLRRKARIKKIPQNKQLVCQDCKGAGGEIERLEYEQGPWVNCGWCEGLGVLLPWERGQWLRIMKEEKYK